MPRRSKEETPEEDDGENYEEEQRSSSRSSRGSGRRRSSGVMQNSGQTDAERRELRHQQRLMNKKINASAHEIGDIGTGKYHEIRNENNELYDNVHYTREAVLDSDNLKQIGDHAARQIDRLVEIPRYDAKRLAQKLRSKCSTNGVFDWKTLGLEVGSCFNAIPSRITFLAGPIQSASSYKPKERKKPERRKAQVEEDVEEEKPDEVHQKSKNKDGDKLSAVETQMNDMTKFLKKKSSASKKRAISAAEEEVGKDLESMEHDDKKRALKKIKSVEPEKVCATQFLFNPESFTQTVENIFSMSFLVKKGKAAIGVRTEKDCKRASLKDFQPVPGPWVRFKKDKDDETAVVPRQSIVSLNMQDWRDMCEAYSVSKGDIPNRTNSAYKSRKST